MTPGFLQIIICLLTGIAVIVVLTAKYRLPAFFALLIACFIVGIGVGISFMDVLSLIKEGFGNILRSLGLLIVLGTTLGVLLEHTGATRVMASYLLKKIGRKNAPLAMNVTGFLVGLPIFCDSGYIVLSGLNNSVAKNTGIPATTMAVSMAAGLYSVHCLVPPHPGASAAAGTIGVDMGTLILTGTIIAIPASLAGYFWAKYAGAKQEVKVVEEVTAEEENLSGFRVIASFLPIFIPILLIALRSFLAINTTAENTIGFSVLAIIGEPVIALSIGILLVLLSGGMLKKGALPALLQDGVEKSGSILVIIGAGGAFGAILAATKIGDHFSAALPLASLGLFFPFLLTSILKTAQGSSTVAIITAASIVQPLLPALGLETDEGMLLSVLAMGAGSMMISHANDAYFWVVAKFSGLEMKSMLKVYTVASIIMGLVSFSAIYMLSFFL